MRIPLLAMALVLIGTSPSLAGSKISLNQDAGGQTELGGVGDAAKASLSTLLAGENQTLNETYTSDSGFAVQYTSTGDKNVKSSAGELVGLLAASGTSVTAVIYDDADGTCSSGVLSGTLTLTNGTFMKFPSRHSTGICITIGGTSPNVTVFYK